MESTSIIKQTSIKDYNFDKNNYMQSVLNEALNINIISMSEIENIQLKIIEIIAKQVEKYTHKESSSVKIDVAQNITQSIFYSIDFYLKSLSNPDMCIDILKRESLDKIYKLAINMIKEEFKTDKQLYLKIKNNRLDIDLIAYNDTIEGINEFFTTYNIDFYSHDAKVYIDYPLAIDKMDTRGITYITHYLEKLFIENEFLNSFEIENIQNLLNRYSIIYGFKYTDMLINIFQIVLTNSVGSTLLKKNSKQLDISYDDCIEIEQIFISLNQNDYENLISQSFNCIIDEFKIINIILKKYINENIINIFEKIKNSVKLNNLQILFVSPKNEVENINIHFEDSKSMDNKLFRIITEEIRDCKNVSDKIKIILTKIKSFKDLVDVLGAYCIFDDEYFDIFNSLKDIELAMLLKVTKFNINDDTFDNDSYLSEEEKQWYNYLINYLKTLDKKHFNTIIEYAGHTFL